MSGVKFLPGVPAARVLERLATAGGDEIGSGKLSSPESSAALAVNTFGWFIERPELLPTLPYVEAQWPPIRVEVEYCARFPWRAGRHPWLDAAVVTGRDLIGVESKRFEPFRDAKTIRFSDAYDRPVFGDRMNRYHETRHALVSGSLRYEHLDAAQLVKHALGLRTDALRLGLKPTLFYLFAEPGSRGERPIPHDEIESHRFEVADFGERVRGDEVGFASSSYREWLASWHGMPADHGANLLRCFAP